MGSEILVFALIVLFAIYLYQISAVFRNIVYSILAIIGIILFFRYFVKKYDEYERGIIFRMGRYSRVAGPGWSLVIPFLEREYAKLDVRTKMMNLNVSNAFTRDDLRINTTGFIYYRVVDPTKAILQIDNYELGMKNMINSETRNVIGNMNMRELFASLDRLNEILAENIRHQLWNWGLDVSMVQILGVSPPTEIITAMGKKFIAKEMLQAQVFNAEAKKTMIEAIGEAAEKLDDRAIMYIYLKALEELGKGQGTKILFPARFMNILQSVGNSMGPVVNGVNLNQAIEAVKSTIMGSK